MSVFPCYSSQCNNLEFNFFLNVDEGVTDCYALKISQQSFQCLFIALANV